MTRIFVAAVAVVFLASSASAQTTDQRVRVSFGAGLTAGAADGELSIAASAGYRFAKNISFEVEFTALEGGEENRFPFRVWNAGTVVDFSGRNPQLTNVPQLQNVGRGIPLQSIFPIPVEGGVEEASTILMTAGFRYEIPVEGTRFRPYVSAGMGLSRTEQEFNFAIATTPVPVPGRVGNTVSSTISSSIPDFEEEFSHTGVMLSAGVGASLRVYKGLSVDLNARYFRLDRSRNLGSFGGGISYRF